MYITIELWLSFYQADHVRLSVGQSFAWLHYTDVAFSVASLATPHRPRNLGC